MKEPHNVKDLLDSGIADYIGFIFYSKSPRYIQEYPVLDYTIPKVGVFVNESFSFVMEKIKEYNLDLVQLHGDEDVEFCRRIRNEGTKVMKVFRVEDPEDIIKTKEFETVSDFFLFDTKTKDYGGSGKTFDWSVLDEKEIGVPFFISGGISPDNIEEVRKLNIKNFYGLDLNSGFEIRPGYKDINMLIGSLK